MSISLNGRMLEQAHIVEGLTPTVPSSTVPEIVNMKSYARCTIIIHVVNSTTVTGSAITVKQCTAVDDTGAKNVTITSMHANEDIAAGDTWTKTAISSSTFTTEATNSKRHYYVIDIDRDSMMDTANGFYYLRLGTGDATAASISAHYILWGAGYGSATGPGQDTALTDNAF